MELTENNIRALIPMNGGARDCGGKSRDGGAREAGSGWGARGGGERGGVLAAVEEVKTAVEFLANV